jgi:hypothetical protein
MEPLVACQYLMIDQVGYLIRVCEVSSCVQVLELIVQMVEQSAD